MRAASGGVSVFVVQSGVQQCECFWSGGPGGSAEVLPGSGDHQVNVQFSHLSVKVCDLLMHASPPPLHPQVVEEPSVVERSSELQSEGEQAELLLHHHVMGSAAPEVTRFSHKRR